MHLLLLISFVDQLGLGDDAPVSSFEPPVDNAGANASGNVELFSAVADDGDLVLHGPGGGLSHVKLPRESSADVLTSSVELKPTKQSTLDGGCGLKRFF